MFIICKPDNCVTCVGTMTIFYKDLKKNTFGNLD